jgi:hypothetical protein
MRPFSLKILPVLLIWVFAYPLQAGTGQAETRNIQYSFTIKNTSNKVVPEVVFQTYGPVPETSWQKVLQTDSSYNYRATGDNFVWILLKSISCRNLMSSPIILRLSSYPRNCSRMIPLQLQKLSLTGLPGISSTAATGANHREPFMLCSTKMETAPNTWPFSWRSAGQPAFRPGVLAAMW